MRLLEELRSAILDEDFFETNQVIERIKQEENAIEYLRPIFSIFESYPDLDYGMPGPIVHFMESYYKRGYEELLLESVQKCPTYQTVWMLNRVINDIHLVNRDKYIEVLKSLLNREDISEFLRRDIELFLQHQQGR